jgi:hypothetical protein
MKIEEEHFQKKKEKKEKDEMRGERGGNGKREREKDGALDTT